MERQLLQEHALWAAQFVPRLEGEAAHDLGLLSEALRHLCEDRRSSRAPQVMRDEVMDVLRRCGEDGSGFEALSIVRAARMIAVKAGSSDAASRADPRLFLETIRALERKNLELERLAARLRCNGLGSLPAAPPDEPAGGNPEPLTEGRWLATLWRLLRRKPEIPESVPTRVMSSKPASDMERLKTIALTVHSEANAKSLYQVVSDWSQEKLRAKQIVRDWASGRIDDAALASAQDGGCNFGAWLSDVEPPHHLAPIIEDLRIWHQRWHALSSEWSKMSRASAKSAFAKEVVRGNTDNAFVHCTKKIDRLLVDLSRLA